MFPIIRVASEAEFIGADLNAEYAFAISIQDAARYPAVLRSDYLGTRLNLYFDDVVGGSGVATSAHIDKIFEFSVRWFAAARRDASKASLIVHCLAGVSRSAAVAMLPLTLYYGDFREAARRLFFGQRRGLVLNPNPHILRLVEETLRPGQTGTIIEAVLEFQR